MNNFVRSLAVHGVIVALVLSCGSTTHRVMRARYRPQVLFLPSAQLMVPLVRPSALSGSSPRAALPAVAKLSIASPAPKPPAAGLEPLPMTLAPVAAPSLPVAHVSVRVAPQPQLGVFGSTTISPVAHQIGEASPAGFGNALGSGTGHGASVVKLVAYERPQPTPAAAQRASEPAIVPPVVTYEAVPVYSQAARAASISGTIVLRVLFSVDGHIKVLDVSHGLGYGLNESAIRTAESIRFKPATREGLPVEFETTVRITFQLADE